MNQKPSVVQRIWAALTWKPECSYCNDTGVEWEASMGWNWDVHEDPVPCRHLRRAS